MGEEMKGCETGGEGLAEAREEDEVKVCLRRDWSGNSEGDLERPGTNRSGQSRHPASDDIPSPLLIDSLRA